MATKKPAPKKAVKSVKPTAKSAKKAAKVVVPKKAAPAKKVIKPIAKPTKKVVVPKKAVAAKKTTKLVVKPVAKKVEKSQKVEKPKKVEKVKKVEKPTKQVKPVKAEKPIKPEKVSKKVEVVQKPVKQPKPEKAPKTPKAKASGIEKSTTVIPMKQLPQKKKEEPIKDIKIPKTSVKTSVPYNPGYTPLEKRVETAAPNTPLVRYSDNELNEFRDLIAKKLETAKKELAYLQGLITRKDELGGDNEDGRYMTMEDGSLSMEREQLSQMASRQITYIDHLEKALMRIESKTYGICRVTGKLIDKARLRAVPHATLSLEAKLGLVKPNSGE